MISILLVIPILYFYFTGYYKMRKGLKFILVLGDFIIAGGFVLMLFEQSQNIGFVVAGAGVIYDAFNFFYLTRKSKNKE